MTFSNKYGTRASQWKSHIVQTASKANQRLGFLRRNLRGAPYKLRELAYLSLVRSTLEYSGAIWDTTVKDESDRLENVQRRSARWARGAKGIISVTTLLRDLRWEPLADRRRNQRLCLFYKIINGELNIRKSSVDINLCTTRARARKSHPLNLARESGRDKYSPYWKGTVVRTIPEWNSLPSETVTPYLKF